jgi:hypothetical protein
MITSSKNADELFATKEKQFILFSRKINDKKWNDETQRMATTTIKIKTIKYDLSSDSFKRELRNGCHKDVAETGVASFFRGFEPRKISGAFSNEKDAVYQKLVEMVTSNESYRSNANFGTVMQRVNRYMAMESYLLLGINVNQHSLFGSGVSQFPKSIIRFMRESNFTFSNKWETKTSSDIKMKMLADLCQHVLTNYHDDLEIYKIVHDMITDWGSDWDHFVTISSPMVDESVTGGWNSAAGETGFNHDYKSVFDYIVKCVRTEAMSSDDCLQEYFDYLKMNRSIEQLKEVNRRKLLGIPRH